MKYDHNQPALNISFMIIMELFVHCYEYTNGVTV